MNETPDVPVSITIMPIRKKDPPDIRRDLTIYFSPLRSRLPLATSVAKARAGQLLRLEFEYDRLFLVRFHLTAILHGGRPLTALLDNTHRFLTQATLVRTGDRLHIAHISFLVHDELHDPRTLDLIVHRIVGVPQVLVQITQPRLRATGELGLDFHLCKGLVIILVILFGRNDHSFAGIADRGSGEAIVL